MGKGNFINRIKYLLSEHLFGKLSDEQKLELNRWRAMSANNEELFNKLSNLEYVKNRYEDFERVKENSPLAKKVGIKHSKKPALKLRWSIAASLTAAATIILGIFLINRYTVESPTRLITINAPHNKILEVVLPDGSQVTLNGGSKVVYPQNFIGEQRVVLFTGEAIFDIAKDMLHPFIVSTGGTSIRVTGTKFNVKSYDDDKDVHTALMEGKVIVEYADSLGRGREIFLRPGDVSVYNKSTKEIKVTITDTYMYSSWKDGVYFFDAKPLESIMIDICRYMDLNYVFLKDELKHKVLSGRIKIKDSALEMIEPFEGFMPGHIKLNGKTIIIQ